MSKKEKAEQETAEITNVEELILNYPNGKYSAIPLAALWAKVLRKREENRHLTPAELLDLALKDILGGSVGWKDVKKAMAAASDAGEGADEKKK
jgi:hypothetical protein